MQADPLAHQVVALIEGTIFPDLEPTSVLGVLALVLAGAGLVMLRDFPGYGCDPLPLLVAEPFPHVEASVGVLLAPGARCDGLLQRLRDHTLHPAVDGLVVVSPDPDIRLLPRKLNGGPVRSAVLTVRTVGPTPR